METLKNTNLQNLKPTKPFHHRLEEEALSPRDLPINTGKSNSTATEDELFEFLTTTSFDVSPAENIIYGGKLIPLNHQNTFFSPPENISHRIRTRSESLSALQGDNLNRTGRSVACDDNAGVMRTSRSLNCRKLTRGPTTTAHSPPENISPAKNTASGSGKSVRPRRWYVIMFGMVKFPPEIELKDIKNRQIRRNIIPPVMFPSPVNRRSHRSPSPSPSWRFLNALSCKEPTSVAATAPFYVTHQ